MNQSLQLLGVCMSSVTLLLAWIIWLFKAVSVMSICDEVQVVIVSLKEIFFGFVGSIHEYGLLSSNYGSLVVALVVAIVLFAVREVFNNAGNCSGIYHTMSTVDHTSFNPYQGMQLFHTLVLYSDGYVVSGTSEKTGDVDKVRSHELFGSGKTRGEINGKVERNYLRRSVMNLHIVEYGEKRESTTFMTIKIRRFKIGTSLESGKFYSTAANSKGRVLCGREPFKDHPLGSVPHQSTLGS